MKFIFHHNLILAIATATIFNIVTSSVTHANVAATPPNGVDVEEFLDAQLPLDLPFTDENGKQIYLGNLFNEGKPVILSLNYSDCPMLCNLQLTGLVNALQEIDGWTAGEQFRIVSVSIDPAETTAKAKETEAKYLNAYGKEDASEGWSFLTGKQDAISKLADTVGFRYRYDPLTKEFYHVAVLIICTPEGKVSRYLYGVEYVPKTVHLSMVEAGEGKIGTSMEQLLLFCFRYDPTSGAYSLAATRIMSFGGLVTLVAVCCLVFPYWFSSSRKKNKQPQANQQVATQ